MNLLLLCFFKELQTIFAFFYFYLSKFFLMKNVKSFVLLTDHSQPSHAIHLLCIRWWPCEYTSPAVPSHSMFCILRCFIIPHLVFFLYFQGHDRLRCLCSKGSGEQKRYPPVLCCRLSLSLSHSILTATCSSQCVILIPVSVPHPGVLRWPGPGRHQHHRPGLRPALPAVLTVSPQQDLLLAWQVRRSAHM